MDKPAGLSTQAPRDAESLESRLRDQLGLRGQYLAFPHRLDRPVSGIVLIALRKRAARLLSDQFASRKVLKQYLAIVSGHVDPGHTQWSDLVSKEPNRAKATIAAGQSDGARQANTRVELVRYNASLDVSLLRMFPETGRMHQLRVQAAHRGHPIVGDLLYGGQPLDGVDRSDDRGELPERIDGEDKILLRACHIEFHHPRDGKRIAITASDIFGDSV